ncbi:ATP-binding protein [Cryobacterium sp. BB736]|uniref:ATP-binding protein n=1 Tax=Cryobacterium sp. BB736 TaxID=2746963 RepID=UPI001875936C|nr:ATP-binding protein [Cryobacterium sp. BB736]
MPRPRNPFKPTAGATPPLLIGREEPLKWYARAISIGPGAPGLLTVFTGPRGIGKTVMLTAVEHIAREHGWVHVSETATPGLLGRIHRQMATHLEELGGSPQARKPRGATIDGSGVTIQSPSGGYSDWRGTATELLAALEARKTGMLITIDEIHAVDRSELSQLAAGMDHLMHEKRAVSLVVAGLSKPVSDLLNEQGSAFLRRADRVNLGELPVPAVHDALGDTFITSGVNLTDDQLDRAAAATGGYPFLMQLVGYHVWRRAISGAIVEEQFQAGIDAATKRLEATVLQAALSDLSGVDKTFLLRMAEDDGPTRTAELIARMGVSDKYVAVYRRRLIDAGVIVAPGRGRVDFAIPHLRDYLRQHAASLTRRE